MKRPLTAASARNLLRLASRLTQREAQIVLSRHGVAVGGQPKTLADLGHEQGVTRERVRQIYNRAMGRLGYPDLEFQAPLEPEPLPIHPCKRCGKLTRNPSICRLRCSGPLIWVNCHTCGVSFAKKSYKIAAAERHPFRVHKGRFFCSKRCQGRHLGRLKSPRTAPPVAG